MIPIQSRARWAVSALFFANGMLLGAWTTQIPLLLVRLGISETTLGFLILAFGLGALLAMPVMGWIISLYGSRFTLIGTSLACSFGLALVVVAPSVPVATVVLFVYGAVFGGMDVTMNAHAVPVERRLGRAIMSSLHGFWSLGGFAGGLTGGWIVLQVGELGHALIVCSVAFALVVAALPFVGEGETMPPGHENETGGPARVAAGKVLKLYLLGLLALFAMLPEGAVIDWAALYLKQELGASVATAGWAYAAFAGAMALVRFVGDGLRDRLGAVVTLRISALIAAVAMLIAAFAPNAAIAIAAFAIAGIGCANIVPVVFSAAGNQPGVASGPAMSVVTTIGYAGVLIGPSGLGFVGDHFGFTPVFVSMAVTLLLVALLAGAASTAAQPGRQVMPSAAL